MTKQNPKEMLRDPWLLAVWPGMGNVALTAGTYLVKTLDLAPVAALQANRFFDIRTARVQDGIVSPAEFPNSRFFGWKNPDPAGRDLLIFLGEDQPSVQGYAFCDTLLEVALEFGVQRVFTFAAMVTSSAPGEAEQLYAIATHPRLLDEVRGVAGGVEVISEGAITGLNGVLLAAAAAQGLEGIGLLGEVPQLAAQIPYPKASRRVLEPFCRLAKVDLDLNELAASGDLFESGLKEISKKLKELAKSSLEEAAAEQDESPQEEDVNKESQLDPSELAHIEALFIDAARDRGQANLLKRELDRLGVFAEYEDRFLDLFRDRDAA